MPGIFHQAGCCCAKPCTDCAGDPADPLVNPQPDVEISVTGICDDECFDLAGTYQYYEYLIASSYCEWFWGIVGVGGRGLPIFYFPSNGKWYSRLYDLHDYIIFGGSDTAPNGWTKCKDVTGLVSCNKTTGKLSGAFDLDGLLSAGGEDCRGCTAHVTLGG